MLLLLLPRVVWPRWWHVGAVGTVVWVWVLLMMLLLMAGLRSGGHCAGEGESHVRWGWTS